MNTYVSALAYFHKLSNFPDPSKCFFIMQMLKGYRKKGQRVDTRLPITLPILHKLVDSAESFSCPNYTKVQFRAMCLLAFYAFLRVGEMTAPIKGACPPIQLCQLTQLVDSTGKIVSLKLTFADYKHNYNRHPFSIIINSQPSHCPVESLLVYLKHRGPMPGPLLIDCGKPITRNIFVEKLSWAVKSCGLDSSRYKGHSFRIGAASYGQTGVCQILKFALWGDGNPMHLLNISGFLLCLLNLVDLH